MTQDDFRAEAQAQLGRWDDPDPVFCGKRKCFPSEEAQLRFYFGYRKAQKQRIAEEYARQHSDEPLTPEDAAVLAEIEEMERAMAMV